MRYIAILLAVLSFQSFVHAEQVDLETDDNFFSGIKNPHEEDDLDRAYKVQMKNKPVDDLMVEDVVMKDEMTSAKTKLMSKQEAAEIDRRMVLENKRRRKAIFQAVSQKAASVKACIDQNKKSFQGTKITLAWMIDPSGKVLMADIRDTDFSDPKVASCVKAAALQIDFTPAAFKQYKKSLVQYTYKVNLKQASSRLPASVKAPGNSRKKVQKTAPK